MDHGFRSRSFCGYAKILITATGGRLRDVIGRLTKTGGNDNLALS